MIQEFNTGKAGPKTHVLLIGVGGYPFLKGGVTPVPQVAEAANLLGQLTSPVVSIETLYRKILEYDNNNEWTKPLGSVDILLTPSPGSPPINIAAGIENASLDHIKDAYDSWKARCDTHIDNVALFYYCGHGAEKDNQFLLADDFGKRPQNPWAGAFNFDLTRAAFKSCKAQTQLFFVDACRQITSDMLEENLQVRPLENPSYLKSDSFYNMTLKAAASGESAYGRKNEPTYFTQAVISGLDGLVARKENNQWLIETGSLCWNIYNLLELINPSQSFKQRCQAIGGGPIDIIRRNNAPNAWLEISCNPDNALPAAELACLDRNLSVKEQRQPKPELWKINLKAGFYILRATFQGGNFKNGEVEATALPPVTREQIICQ